MALKSENKVVSRINMNFLIRWKNQDEKGSNLVSAGRYHMIVGEEMRDRHFKKVLQGMRDKYVFMIRKRLKITFISK